MAPKNTYDPRVPAKKAAMTRGQGASAQRSGAQAYATAKGYKPPSVKPVSMAQNAESDRMSALAESYLRGGDPQNLAGKAPAVGGNAPQMLGSGGSGGFSSGGGSSIPVGQPATPTLEEMLAQLPQGPTGIPETQGAYDALMAKFKDSEGRIGGYYDESMAKLKGIFGGANAGYETGNTDYLRQLQALQEQNQSTALGSLEGLKNVRQTFMGDMGTSIGARSTSAVQDIIQAFNEQKALQEQQIIEAYMAQQAELAASSGGGGGSRGGGGGGYGSGGSSGPTTITDTANETGTVTNPQNVAMLMELAQYDPKAAAALQREMDISYGGPLAGIRKTYDAGAADHAGNVGKYIMNTGLATALPSIFSKSKAKATTKAGNAAANAGKSQKALQSLQAALDTARGFGGMYANPKVTQQVKTASSKKTKYK